MIRQKHLQHTFCLRKKHPQGSRLRPWSNRPSKPHCHRQRNLKSNRKNKFENGQIEFVQIFDSDSKTAKSNPFPSIRILERGSVIKHEPKSSWPYRDLAAGLHGLGWINNKLRDDAAWYASPSIHPSSPFSIHPFNQANLCCDLNTLLVGIPKGGPSNDYYYDCTHPHWPHSLTHSLAHTRRCRRHRIQTGVSKQQQHRQQPLQKSRESEMLSNSHKSRLGNAILGFYK